MSNKKTIMDYFNDEVEYPNDVALNPLPMNTFWSYISSTFLDGFINYVEPLKIYVLDRYADDKTDAVLNLSKQCHTKLSQFGDDIILLGKIENNEDSLNKFMLFWFDMDVSDCCIGRFETTDNNETVFEALVNWLEEKKAENKGKVFHESYDNGVLGFHELPKSFIEGWVSF
jgi:hypothetical protein